MSVGLEQSVMAGAFIAVMATIVGLSIKKIFSMSPPSVPQELIVDTLIEKIHDTPILQEVIMEDPTLAVVAVMSVEYCSQETAETAIERWRQDYLPTQMLK